MNKVAFYIVAHADDWQLFMYPNVFTDLATPCCRVIFIITTAGDSGMGEKFWLGREEGLKSSIRFCLAPLSVIKESGTRQLCNNHTLQRYTINNTVTYFLRLPDGDLDGAGFRVNNFQSLSKFYARKFNDIISVDHCSGYYEWPEFLATIESIIKTESESVSDIRVHYPNPDIHINSNDHADHIATGIAIQTIVAPHMHQFLYNGYSIDPETAPLDLTGIFWKAGIFAAYEKAVYDFCGYSTLREDANLYRKWCCSQPKIYTTTQKQPK